MCTHRSGQEVPAAARIVSDVRAAAFVFLVAAVVCGASGAQPVPAGRAPPLRSYPGEWSPDGSRLFFWSNLGTLESDPLARYVVNADGTGLERVLPDRADGEYLRTPDGRRVAFLRNDGVLYSIDEAGVEQDVIARDITRYGSVSPDGSLYAYARAVSLKLAHTLIVEIPAGAVRGVVIGFNPVFSPDGTKLAVEDDDTVIAYDLESGKAIFDSYGCCYNPEPIVFSPDGVHAAFSGASKERGDDTGDVYVADLRTGTYRRVAPGGSIDSWSPDGARIAFGGWWSIRSDGTGLRRLLDPIPGAARIRLSSDWTRYAFSVSPVYRPVWGTDLYIRVVGEGPPRQVSPSQCTTVTDQCLQGSNREDRIRGGEGRDLVFAGFGNDRVAGGAGHDVLDGEHGADVVAGGPGRDTLFGEFGNDVLRGGPGGDALRGGHGADRLLGGQGKDTLFGNPGSDEIAGGPGSDLVVADSYDDHDRISCGSGVDRVRADRTDRVAADCEHVTRRRDP
jgi:hypothetical protein